MKKLFYFGSRCTGCRYCEIACSLRHQQKCGRIDSLIRIVSNDKDLVNRALFCRQCQKPVCIGLCPVGAISKDIDGVVNIDDSKCTGCGACADCPWGGIYVSRSTGIAMNCDLCRGDPACVEFCKWGAIIFVPPEEARSSRMREA